MDGLHNTLKEEAEAQHYYISSIISLGQGHGVDVNELLRLNQDLQARLAHMEQHYKKLQQETPGKICLTENLFQTWISHDRKVKESELKHFNQVRQDKRGIGKGHC